MQFDLRKFITAGRQPYHAEFQCDLSAHDYAGARIPQPVTAVFDAETDGDEIRMTLRANALVHGECARCLDPVTREETVDTEWTVKERDLDDPDFELPALGEAFLKIGLIMIGLANRYILGNEPSERALPPGVPLSTCSRIFAKHIRYKNITNIQPGASYIL